MPDEPAQKRKVRRDAADLRLLQRPRQAVERLLACVAGRDELGDHRVVRGTDLVPLAHTGVDADPLGQSQPLEPAGLRQERARILRIQPDLDRMAAQVTVCYKVGQGLSGRDVELLAHDVDARHELGDRMLDLDPRVELEEPEVAAVEDELGGAGALVADRAREGDRGVAHRRPQLGVERRRRCLFEHLLMPALDRAVALAERRNVAVRVGEELDLDVAGPLEVALAEDRVVAERSRRLAPRRGERLVELLGRTHDTHAAAAAAGGRLDEQREADLLRRPARQDGDARRARCLLRRELVAPARSADGGGPTQVSPASSTASASSALSERNP